MNGYSIKEAAIELNISDKALYKRISSENFNSSFITKIDGKTVINDEGLNYLKSVVKKRKSPVSSGEEEMALSLDIDEKNISEINNFVGTRIDVYTQNEIDIINLLKDQIDFLREQLRLQTDTYQESLKIQLENIKSKEEIILNMQDIIKSEQENTKKLLSYDERSREVDEKLSQIRRELVGRKAKRKKSFFSFIR